MGGSGGQAAGAQSGGSFVLGREGAEVARDAVRDGDGEVYADGGSQGQSWYGAGGIKMWSGLGRNLISNKTKLS